MALSDYKGVPGVYRLTIPGFDFAYIGESGNIYERINTHVRELKNGTHDNATLQSYYDMNSNLHFRVLERDVASVGLREQAEKYYIAEERKTTATVLGG